MADLERVEMAFPVATVDGYTQYGMTLRDYFAAQAMASLITAVAQPKVFEKGILATVIVAAYEMADLMLEERKK